MRLTGHQEKGAAYYDAVYSNGYSTSNYYPLYQEVLRTLDTYWKPRILEIGCGLGDLGRLIIERGYPYRGFDFSLKAVQKCLQRCSQGNFQVGDAYNPDSYRPYDYNVIIALEVLEHLDDLRVMESIPPGVRIIASVPNYDDVAHLRLYQDPQRDIAERFRPQMQLLTVKAGRASPESDGTPRTIFVFHGIKLVT